MPTYRTAKHRNFTVVDNRYLKNPGLSLKAKGLMTILLSLPDQWNFSISGLATLSRDRECAVRSAIHELEEAGHVTRLRQKNPDGTYNTVEYVIREIPEMETPPVEYPALENPAKDIPPAESRLQLNTDQSNTYKSNTDLLNIQSDPGGKDWSRTSQENMRHQIMENIQYALLLQEFPCRQGEVTELLEIILETLCSGCRTIRVSRKDYPAEYVKQRLLTLEADHIRYVMECLQKNTTRVQNMKQYLLTALFNAPVTIDSHYSAMVSHDLAHGVVCV